MNNASQDRAHYIFRIPTGRTIGNGVGQLGGGWGDVRGANGVIMAEPSVHADGGCYEWDYGQDERGNFLDPQVLPVPTLPIALDELLPARHSRVRCGQ